MKVRCVRLLNSKGLPEEHSEWVVLEKIYHVLELSAGRERITVRILGEIEMTPAIYDLRQFEIVSPKIPPNWILCRPTLDQIEFTPASWARSGFWEDFFNGMPDAINCFETERQKIMEFDP